MAETKNIWAELRKPFDPKAVGKLPKGGINLDYVGHAAVTDRLNTVDPTWTWEPMAFDAFGNPMLIDTHDNFNKPLKGLWMKLTINGVTRPAFGDGKTEKEAIGDAIRNGAMRFGVALDLWSKDELESNIENPENKNVKPSEQKYQTRNVPISDDQLKSVVGLLERKGLDHAGIGAVLTRFALETYHKDSIKGIDALQYNDLITTISAMDGSALKNLITKED